MHVSVQAGLRQNRERLIKSVITHWAKCLHTRITLVILELIREHEHPDRKGGVLLSDLETNQASVCQMNYAEF